ncbi:FecR domain-containing protein [Aquimarina sp. MMG016]|uniref:FecR family protein n=1 Tax=Aquimarina sp. MMG016 TaxID=2822690 RepID=UPI001B3A63F6|nr:FecR domain-containing protein [Aquimarina sp. MMG016]MBQ4822279.1 DUF4974 domain-containing protein [Aquimarina sp. MMG016]
MKDDKGHLEELLQSKFKDDVVKPSTNMFDDIYDALQEEKTNRNYLPWYQAGIIALIICAILGLYYFTNNKTSEKTDIIPETSEQDINITPAKNEKPIIQKEEQQIVIDTIKTIPAVTKEPVKTESPKEEIITSQAEEDLKEKGLIGMSYIASEKYASTKQTKYLKLPDSSTIVLRRSSRVNYYDASLLNYRRVYLTGTVFFSINDNTSKPFVIYGKQGKVEVHGNSFAMSTKKDGDYMTLIEGSAEITHLATDEKQKITPGESFKITTQEIVTIEKSPNQFAWKTGNLYYQNVKLEEILNDLEENFDAKIRLKNRSLLNCQYTGNFNDAATEKVLNSIVKSLTLKLSKKDGVYIISGKGNCN